MRPLLSRQVHKIIKLYNDFFKMKADIHPKNYRLVVFRDFSAETAWLTRSAINTKDTIVWEDGKEYPLAKLEISSYSHPFFTGKMKFVDTAGRIDKFNKKFAKFAANNPDANNSGAAE